MNANAKRPGLVIILNSSIALNFVRGQLEYFQSIGFDVTVFCPPRRKDEWEVRRPRGVSIIEMPMAREISPVADVKSLWRLWREIRTIRPLVTNVGTPKAGLLGGMAAWLNRVPCRIYTLHGLRFETTKGFTRQLLVWAERLACFFAHRVVCVSQSAREKALAARLGSLEKIAVLGSGSCNGVDLQRFAPNPELAKRANEIRHRLGIPFHAPVALFVGRLTCDKGIPELMQAFSQLSERVPDLRLLLVGCFEDGDPLPSDVRESLQSHPRVIFAGAVPDTAPYYAAADCLVLPSHREGLPLVVLEAQAAGKPVIGAAATGIVDVVTHGQTGLLFPVGNITALSEAIATVITDKGLAAKLGLAGQEQVQQRFQQEKVWQRLHREYLAILQGNDQPIVPAPVMQSASLPTSANVQTEQVAQRNYPVSFPPASPA